MRERSFREKQCQLEGLAAFHRLPPGKIIPAKRGLPFPQGDKAEILSFRVQRTLILTAIEVSAL